MRSGILISMALFALPALAQDPLPPPNGQRAAFADLQVQGDVRLAYPDNGGLREVVDIDIRFALGLSDGIQPMSEGLIVNFNAIPPAPCNLVTIPPGAFVPTNNGYRLISDDPKLSGVTYLRTDGQGQVLEDLTGNLVSLDATLRQTKGGSWQLFINATSLTAGDVQWMPIVSTGTEVSFGDDFGSSMVSHVKFAHGMVDEFGALIRRLAAPLAAYPAYKKHVDELYRILSEFEETWADLGALEIIIDTDGESPITALIAEQILQELKAQTAELQRLRRALIGQFAKETDVQRALLEAHNRVIDAVFKLLQNQRSARKKLNSLFSSN